MSNLKDYNRGRNDGLAMALRIAESDGIEGLRKEIKFRGVTGIHTALAKKELDQASKQIKEMTLDTMIVLAVATLHDISTHTPLAGRDIQPFISFQRIR